jgi:hypothetical protein
MPRTTAHKPNAAAQPEPLGKMRDAPEQRVYLAERWGIKVSLRTLQDWRVTGQGPPLRRSGRTPLYEEFDTDAWAMRRLSRSHRSTTEEQQAQRHLVDTAA